MTAKPLLTPCIARNALRRLWLDCYISCFGPTATAVSALLAGRILALRVAQLSLPIKKRL